MKSILLKFEIAEFSSLLTISGSLSTWLISNTKVLLDSLSGLTVLNIINDFLLALLSASTNTLVQP